MSRVIYYYQTFTGLYNLIKQPHITHLHLAAVHFGKNSDGSPYIHLNDLPPDDSSFDPMWKDVRKLPPLGIRVLLMIGGAGGAFQTLFSDFSTYYPMLKQTLLDHPEITGVDLDVEEAVDLIDLRKLIKQIDTDFPDYLIAMAPVQGSLATDYPGMGNFSYKQLYQTAEGQRIDYFNAQCYYDYSLSGYSAMVANGYPADKIVMGMTSDQLDKSNQKQISDTLISIRKKYPDFGGVFDWEYFNAYPTANGWSKLMVSLIDPTWFWKLVGY